MKRCFSAAVAAFVLNFLVAFGMAQAADASDTGASFRPARVRAFAPENNQSLILREGRSHYRRLTLAESCPALIQASRVTFQSGPSLTGAHEQGRQVPVVRGQAPAVVSTGTRSAFVVAIGTNSRTACRLAGVTVVGQAAFEAAAQLHGQRDNRYAGDGHSS